MEENIFSQIEKIRKEIKDNFVYIDNLEDCPKRSGGSMVEKLNLNPGMVFHFLEFIFECEHVDLDALRGTLFVDDKVTWEFLLKTEFGYIRIYDWKGYSVSIGSVDGLGNSINENLSKKITLLKKIIEENIDKFIDFRKNEAKRDLEERPLDNFMHAFVSLNFLLEISLEANKKGRTGFIESLILYVSLIDTMLRYCILLTRINQRKSKKVDPDLPELFHQDGKKFLSERAIFDLAQKEVDFLKHNKSLFFETVNSLYDERNKAVHRYAITNFQYSEIKDILQKNLGLKDILFELVVSLEKEQSELGVGFITKSDLALSDEDSIEEMKKIIETKIDPAIFTKKTPVRESMFSGKYKGGINPKVKKVMKKIQNEANEKFKWEKTGDNKFELRQINKK